MAEPQKKQDEEPQPNPELGAIIPEKDEVGNFLQEFDAYQKKLDEEWEKAKTNYQKKVNNIMEEYIHQQVSEKSAEAETPPTPENKPSTKESQPEPTFQQRMESLLARVENELHKPEPSSRTSFFDEFRITCYDSLFSINHNDLFASE